MAAVEDISRGLHIGRLTGDAELKHIGSGTAVSNFSIAVNEKFKEGEEWKTRASFLECVLWGRQAEALSPYLLKGQKVGIEARPKQERWETDNGKRSKIVFVISSINLLGGKNEGGVKPSSDAGESHTPSSVNLVKNAMGGTVVDDYDDDIPL